MTWWQPSERTRLGRWTGCEKINGPHEIDDKAQYESQASESSVYCRDGILSHLASARKDSSL